MKLILGIGRDKYVSKKDISNEDIVRLLSMFRGMQRVEKEHTSDYRGDALVIQSREERITFELESDDAILTREQWQAFKADYESKLPKEKEVKSEP